MNDVDLTLSVVNGFNWDSGNEQKNRLKHNVTKKECEEVFFNEPIIIFDDPEHSTEEKRYKVLGISDNSRLISLVFTIRINKIRVITARDQSKKEKAIYKLEQNDL